MQSVVSIFLGLVLLGLLISRDRLNQRVRHLETRLERLLLHLGFDADQIPPATDEVKALARTPGGKIAAIKAYRQQTGAGLREAKTEVERLMRSDASPPS